MNLRRCICYLLARLRIHSPDCEHCKAREACGREMLKRLEELNWRTYLGSLHNRDQVGIVEVPDSKLPRL